MGKVWFACPIVCLLTKSRYIDAETGRRSDAAHHYIYNQSHNSNLTILDRSWVIRVIFEYVFPACISLPVSLYWFSSRNDWAVGVEYISEGRDGESGQPTTSIVKASRLVVVSAGAFGSPMILERSGIGGKEVLEKNGVPQVVDLPGVGEHYMGQLPSFVRFGIRNS